MKHWKFPLVCWILIPVLLCCSCIGTQEATDDPTETAGDPSTPSATDAPSQTPDSTATPHVTEAPATPKTFWETVDAPTWAYYQQIALYVEYGSAKDIIKKWTEPIRVYIGPGATQEDLTIIHAHLDDLRAVPHMPEISETDSEDDANMTVLFVNREEMDAATAPYETGANGYTTIWWNTEGSITQAKILVKSEGQTQLERRHTLLEEITQALGLLNDLDWYSNSIFYIHYAPDILSLSEMDWQVVRIHYTPEIRPGMTGEEVRLFGETHLHM